MILVLVMLLYIKELSNPCISKWWSKIMLVLVPGAVEDRKGVDFFIPPAAWEEYYTKLFDDLQTKSLCQSKHASRMAQSMYHLKR